MLQLGISVVHAGNGSIHQIRPTGITSHSHEIQSRSNWSALDRSHQHHRQHQPMAMAIIIIRTTDKINTTINNSIYLFIFIIIYYSYHRLNSHT